MDGVNDRTGYLQHFRHVTKETGSGTFACHFFHGAAKIDVDEVRVRLLHYACGICHGFGLTTVYLNRHRPLGIGDG